MVALNKRCLITITIPVFLFSGFVHSQTTYNIRLNQIGFLPNTIKYAAVVNSPAETFKIKTADLSSVVYTGQFGEESYFSSSDEYVKIADFTSFNAPGEYVLAIDGLGTSVPFTIGDNALTGLAKGTIKALYFNRASMKLEAEYAGKWAREMGHPDTAVVVHPSAATATRPAGTIISTPYGWYDAGDYNKYIVNSGISMFTLLSAYETYPDFYDTLTLNIPESNNDIPDILDEALWNLKWVIIMQDTTDGGVYNKTTTASFEGTVMPAQATSTRYVVTKATAATLDFAAMMAMTARIYKDYLPDMADEALQKAIKAWQWAKANPNIPFENPSASGIYPRISTGSYGDEDFSDEFIWAATELYITTGDESYYAEIDLGSHNFGIPNSGTVSTLGLISLITHRKSLAEVVDTTLAKQKLLDAIESSKNYTTANAYRLPGEFYGWGGNGFFGNCGMLLMQAFTITGDAGYFNAAVSTLDYLVGRNATTYSFVTGYGTKYPKNIHHRISRADGIVESVPGWLAGGPNPGNMDKDCGASAYPSSLPARAYLDNTCSYTTNEVAINWNAPLAFLTGAIQYEYLNHFKDGMPDFFIKSVSQVTLPYKSGHNYEVNFSANIDWELSASAEWLNFSSESGSGSSTISIFSTTDNLEQENRKCVLYIKNDSKIIDSIQIVQNGVRTSFLIQSEDYADMLGLQNQTTTDYGGGLNVGYVDVDDWIRYDVDISYAGIYSVGLRHAGYACNFSVYIDSVYQKDASFSATSDWQVWKTTEFDLCLEEGYHDLLFVFHAQGLNMNWLQFDRARDVDSTCQIPNSIEDVTQNDNRTNHLLIFPVPAKNSINVKMINNTKIERIELFNIEGQTILTKEYNSADEANINIAELKEGIYYIKVKCKEGIYGSKVLVFR